MALMPETVAIPDYSQCGEGKIILDLLGKLPVRDKQCVEIGAADGIYMSNTRHLSECFGYSATLIEADPKLYELLRKNLLPSSKAICRMVGWTASKVDDLDIPMTPDFMSIDIDGNDYHVWAAMEKCRPKIVCIEHNPTVSNEVAFVQVADFAVQQGAGIRALVELGASKGYQLAAVTPYNAFFVDGQFFGSMGIADNRLSTLRPDPPLVTYLFAGYDGHVFLRGPQVIPWHDDFRIFESQVQAMPKRLQKYSHTKVEAAALKVWAKLRSWLCR